MLLYKVVPGVLLSFLAAVLWLPVATPAPGYAAVSYTCDPICQNQQKAALLLLYTATDVSLQLAS